MRHGEASFDAPSDDERQLTSRGKLIVRDVAQNHLEDLSHVETIVHSPLVRAQQTASIVADCIGRDIPMEISPLLRPESAPQRLAEALNQRAEGTLLLVTHQPFVSYWLDWLEGAESGKHSMTTASLACLDLDIVAEGLATLNWLHHPR